MNCRRLVLVSGCLAWLALPGCHGRADVVRVEVRTLALDPPPGASGVVRQPVIRAQFEVDLDPASCHPGTCRLDGPHGAVAVVVGYDAASRAVTIAPRGLLARGAPHRVWFTGGLRTAGGEGLRRGPDWTFTTADVAAWEPTQPLAAGRLCDLLRGEDGVVYALWVAPDGRLLGAADDGTGFAVPFVAGVANFVTATGAADRSGRLAVAALTAAGDLWLIQGSRTGFGAPLFVAAQARDVDVALADSGHVALGWYRSDTPPGTPGYGANFGGRVRLFVPGQGLAAEHALPPTIPRVWLAPGGEGLAVCGFYYSYTTGTFPYSQGFAVVSCVRYCLDALGGLAICDPPGTGGSTLASLAAFAADGGVLLAQRVRYPVGQETADGMRVYSAAPGSGWQQEPPTSGGFDLPVASALAAGATGAALFVSGSNGNGGTRAWSRAERTAPWVSAVISDAGSPPTGRSHAATVTAAGGAAALWATYTTAPPLRATIAGAHRGAGDWSSPVVLDAPPFDYNLDEACGLTAVPQGADGALAAWTNGSEIRIVRLR